MVPLYLTAVSAVILGTGSELVLLLTNKWILLVNATYAGTYPATGTNYSAEAYSTRSPQDRVDENRTHGVPEDTDKQRRRWMGKGHTPTPLLPMLSDETTTQNRME